MRRRRPSKLESFALYFEADHTISDEREKVQDNNKDTTKEVI